MIADVDQAPRAHLVPFRVGAAEHPSLERRLLPGGERVRPARARPVVQALDPFGVVAQHRVPERLALHPGEPGGFGAREAVERMGDGQEPHGGSAIRLVPCETAQLGGGQVLADGERGHGGPPARILPCVIRPCDRQVSSSVSWYHTDGPGH
jgi:hypothetical protein